MEQAITVAGLLLGIGAIWTLGYIKGRWDAAASIGRRYHVTPKSQ